MTGCGPGPSGSLRPDGAYTLEVITSYTCDNIGAATLALTKVESDGIGVLQAT